MTLSRLVLAYLNCYALQASRISGNLRHRLRQGSLRDHVTAVLMERVIQDLLRERKENLLLFWDSDYLQRQRIALTVFRQAENILRRRETLEIYSLKLAPKMCPGKLKLTVYRALY